jgi:hypothetical protein
MSTRTKTQTSLDKFKFKPKRGPGRIRGLTRAQYLVLSRMVRLKETTWDRLEQEGIVLPPQSESNFRRSVKRRIAEPMPETLTGKSR